MILQLIFSILSLAMTLIGITIVLQIRKTAKVVDEHYYTDKYVKPVDCQTNKEAKMTVYKRRKMATLISIVCFVCILLQVIKLVRMFL